MTHRQRMLAAMRGQPTDQIPWAPRMDLCYLALRARGAVPDRFAGMDDARIAQELDVGCHSLRGDFTLPRPPQSLMLRSLGMDNHPDYPYQVEVDDLPATFEHVDGRQELRIRTSAGDLTSCLRMTREMTADGISLPFVDKYPISCLEDFARVAEVFEHLRITPTPRAYAAFQQRIGEQGLAVANGPLGASPMHLLLHELMSMEDFYLFYAEHREQMTALAQRMEPTYEAILDALMACDAEVVFWGANYDQDLTWPPFFDEEIAPWLRRVSQRAHAAGKLVLTHTDGENRSLLAHYPACGFDVAESVCPAPMTQCTLAEVRAGMGDHITVWGGIPCVVLLDASMDQAAFERHMDELFSQLGNARRLILGVSDNVPPDVNFARLEQVKQWISRFGAVN